MLGPDAPDLMATTAYVTPSERILAGGYSFACRLDLQPFLDLVGVKTKPFRYRNLTSDSPMAGAAAQCFHSGINLEPHGQSKFFYAINPIFTRDNAHLRLRQLPNNTNAFFSRRRLRDVVPNV